MKKKHLFLVILILVILHNSCSKNPTQPQEGALTGVVTFEGQENHGGILVRLQELERQIATSAAGDYSFSAVPVGTYTLLATDGDSARHLFDFALAEGISVTAGRTTTVPTMELPLFQRIENDLAGQVRWNPEESPYLIAQSVTVLPQAKLSIEPGTIVKFAGYHRLTVLGHLVAKGTATDSIFITTVKTDGAPGDWDRISIERSGEALSDTLTYCHIQYGNIGLACSQAFPVICRNSICCCSGYGLVNTASTIEIRGNLLRDNYGGISCENGSAGIIEANIIEENTTAGIACAGSSPQISDNVVANNQRGLQVQSESDPLVWHNEFSSNEDAIYLFYYCDPHIEANEISSQQRFGFHLVGYNKPQIHFNNITQNGGYLAYLSDQYQDVPAQNNWWDTDDPNEVSTGVWDGNDNALLGKVLLDPILTAPVDSAGPRISP
jgi:hypothetical protein